MNVRLVVHPVRRSSATGHPGNARAARFTSRRLARARRWPLALGLAALLGGCAGVNPLGPQPLAGAAQSAVQGRGNVNVRLNSDGVATTDASMPEYRSRTTTHDRNMAGARALWRATGMKGGDFDEPILAIAISNSFTRFVPGHVHLKDLGHPPWAPA